jgi:hypothetical protein
MLWQHFYPAGRMFIDSQKAVSLLQLIARPTHKPYIQFPTNLLGRSFLRGMPMLAKFMKLLLTLLNHSDHLDGQERREFVQKIAGVLSDRCIVVVAIKQVTLEPHVLPPSNKLDYSH